MARSFTRRTNYADRTTAQPHHHTNHADHTDRRTFSVMFM
jgi:hypothetical protein